MQSISRETSSRKQDIQLNKEDIDLSALMDNTSDSFGDAKQDEGDDQQQDEQGQQYQQHGDGDDDGSFGDGEQEILSPEEVLKRRHIVLKLRAYVTKFPKHFKGIDWREFQYYDLERLEATMDEFKYLIGTSTGASVVHMAATIGLGAIERLGRMTPLKLDGFGEAAAQDEAIQDIINEISIEYGCGLEYVSPEKRLMFSLCKIAMVTHGINVAREKSDEAELARRLAKEATAELIESSRDL